MGRDADHLPIYHGPGDPNLSRADVLCRVMDLALTAYNDLVGDMLKGNLAMDTYDSWVDFDGCHSFNVVEVVEGTTVGGAAAGPGLYVRYDGQVLTRVDGLDTARELIEDASGRRIRLAADTENGFRIWWPEPRGQAADPPHEPAAGER
jgi:hypothetical protein